MIDYKISTITMSMQIHNCQLNLINIGKYLNIDDEILGIKYNYGETSILKGKYSTSIYNKSKVKNENKINKKLFYNQVSLIIKNNETNNINVKIFGNGSLHLTGVKDPKDGKKMLIIIYKKLISLINTYDNVLLTKDLNDVFIDNNNIVYGNTDNKIIGYKYNSMLDLYIINKKEYVITTIKNKIYFISNKFENKRTKSILNLNGNYVGYSKIVLVKNKSKLYKNNSNIHFENDFIYYDVDNNSTIIGNITYTFNEIESKHLVEHDIIELKYNCTPFQNLNENLNEDYLNKNFSENINSINIYFKLSFELNRERLYKQLIINKYNCEYKHEYSGVKFTYKNNENQTGICACNNKCTCKNITFLIFQTGNIIVSGLKSLEQIKIILESFEKIIIKIEGLIKKKILV